MASLIGGVYTGGMTDTTIGANDPASPYYIDGIAAVREDPMYEEPVNLGFTQTPILSTAVTVTPPEFQTATVPGSDWAGGLGGGGEEPDMGSGATGYVPPYYYADPYQPGATDVPESPAMPGLDLPFIDGLEGWKLPELGTEFGELGTSPLVPQDQKPWYDYLIPGDQDTPDDLVPNTTFGKALGGIGSMLPLLLLMQVMKD